MADIYGAIKELNQKLIAEMELNQYQENPFDFKGYMIRFINSLEDITIGEFKYVDEVNNQLTTLEDMEAFIDFKHTKGMDDVSAFYVKEVRQDIYFLTQNEFSGFCKTVIDGLDNEDVVRFNSFAMDKLFEVGRKYYIDDDMEDFFDFE